MHGAPDAPSHHAAAVSAMYDGSTALQCRVTHPNWWSRTPQARNPRTGDKRRRLNSGMTATVEPRNQSTSCASNVSAACAATSRLGPRATRWWGLLRYLAAPLSHGLLSTRRWTSRLRPLHAAAEGSARRGVVPVQALTALPWTPKLCLLRCTRAGAAAFMSLASRALLRSRAGERWCCSGPTALHTKPHVGQMCVQQLLIDWHLIAGRCCRIAQLQLQPVASASLGTTAGSWHTTQVAVRPTLLHGGHSP